MSAYVGKAPTGNANGFADGEVSIEAGGNAVSGWMEVSISAGMDMAPSTFELAMTERSPSDLSMVKLNKGDACTIKIGGDLVLTGWINRYSSSVSAGTHTIRVSGRSRCQDLVDCSAIPKNLSINNAVVGAVAQDLVAPFKGPITVQMPDGDGSGKAYVVGVSWGETPWEIISEIASYEGLLIYDDAKGDLVIRKIGTAAMASGFAEGVNCQEFGVSDADDMLFSLYIPALMAQDSLQLIGPGGNAAGNPVPDPLVTRYRPLVIVSDQMVQGQLLAQQRAVWEATRRRGRSKSVSVTVDSWRDSAGTLWTHNMLAPIDLPSIHVSGVKWIIASWRFIRDREGTRAEITLMPPEAFSVQPSALGGQNFQVAQANLASQQAATTLGQRNPGAGSAITAPNALTNAGPNQNVRAGDGYGL